MQETISLTLEVIRLSSLAFIFCACIGITIFIITKSQDRLYKNYRLLMPMYYMFFAITAFCGITLLAFNFFQITLRVILMIAAFTAILITSIKSYKFSKNREFFIKFQSFTRKKYMVDVAICCLVFLGIKYLG
ncbi:MAG: hypothetical protein LBG67_04165 [Campylobacteraceae bacterium]|jgi:hypothetical protein|nr:hypothetical protein [Campylobacteraceae bacterium]